MVDEESEEVPMHERWRNERYVIDLPFFLCLKLLSQTIGNYVL